MRLYRCRICGDTYLGAEAPAHCPFCGAVRSYFVDPADFPSGINDVTPSDQERSDLEASIEIETSNTRFYLAAASGADNDNLRSYFKRLAKVEAEHCGVFCKILGQAKPDDLMTPAESNGSSTADLEDSLAREDRATKLYGIFAERASDTRIREVFTAIGEVESTHILLDQAAKAYL